MYDILKYFVAIIGIGLTWHYVRKEMAQIKDAKGKESSAPRSFRPPNRRRNETD